MTRSNRTAVIVQARMASTRLPGKTMMLLDDHTAIAHVLHRCKAIPGADVVVCAVADTPECDVLAAEAMRCDVVVTRGSETDVLERYRQAARQVEAETVMRVTSDCPLIDPIVCGAVLQLRAQREADYACNNMPPSWPHGLDCEAFTAVALEKAADAATTQLERDHVTAWIRNNAAMRRINLPRPGKAADTHRWTLDYPEDLAFFRAVLAKLPKWPAISGTDDILAMLAKHPEITAINAMRRDHSRAPAA